MNFYYFLFSLSYISPPPSRPRTDDVSNSIEQKQNVAVRGQVISYQQPSLSYFDDISRYNNVPSLAVRYIPNVGLRYYAVVVPIMRDTKLHHLQTNQVDYGTRNNNGDDKYLYKREFFDKPNGKYNAKLKKYKAYEVEKKKLNNENVPYNAVSIIFFFFRKSYALTTIVTKFFFSNVVLTSDR